MQEEKPSEQSVQDAGYGQKFDAQVQNGIIAVRLVRETERHSGG